MIVERKAVERYLSEFDEKAKKAYDEYQKSGSPSYERKYRKYRKYDTLAEALRTVLEYDDRRNDDISKRIRNIKNYAEMITDKTYTKDEVYELLLEVAYWR